LGRCDKNARTNTRAYRNHGKAVNGEFLLKLGHTE
jgi:hypothetical protein